MAGIELVKHRRAREVDVVAAHAHHLVVVIHRVGRERHLDHLAAEEERADTFCRSGDIITMRQPSRASGGMVIRLRSSST